MKIVINPKYERLREWIIRLPETFTQQGEVIYDARNQIRLMQHDGYSLCVKRFRKPNLINRVAYTYFRAPKAERAYENAIRLQEAGIGTPEPVAYILCDRGLIKESYLITIQSRLAHTFYDFRDGETAGKEDLIRAFAHYAASLHNAGVLHKDFSPGNILYGKEDGKWTFEIVDINRMRFGQVAVREGCNNLCRLWGKSDFFEILSPVYAQDRQIDEKQCLEWIQAGRKAFWAHHAHEHFVTDDTFSVGVIVSTYNNPEWLEKTLWGLKYQSRPADEIIIADDGSDERTRQLIDRYSTEMPLQHIWHEDQGFRKTTILNQAVEAAQSEYLIFIDQDLIARNDFIAQHCRHACRGRFVSGGAIRLPEALSHALSEEDIRTGNAFRVAWLRRQGMVWNWKMSKLCSSSWLCALLNTLTPAKASWNGGNSSTWKEYILRANGFDTRMHYGAEDREFGQRLENAGITGIQMRYGLPLLHLYHERPYRNKEDWQRNLSIWKETRSKRITKTQYGIHPIHDSNKTTNI